MGLAWADETLAISREIPIPIEQLSCVSELHFLMKKMSGAKWRTMQTLGAGHIEIGFVDGGHFDLGRE